MFSWFKRKAKSLAPPAADMAAKPVDVAPTTEPQKPLELTELAADLLRGHDHQVVREGDSLVLEPSGLRIRPVLVALEQRDDAGGVKTTCVTHVNHPSFGAAGVFEYQHSFGSSAEDALVKGFDQWRQLDLVALLDALRAKPTACMLMQMDFPATDQSPARARRVVLSPVAHFAQRPLPAPEPGSDAEAPHASSCPCCLFLNSVEPFKPLLESDGFYAIRLYAARDVDGVPQADCRINGEDSPEGMQALRDYVTRWPDQGVEFRKQYVIVQPNRPSSQREASEAWRG